MSKEFRSLGVFAAFSRWSLDNCRGGSAYPPVDAGNLRLSSKLPNSKGQTKLEKLEPITNKSKKIMKKLFLSMLMPLAMLTASAQSNDYNMVIELNNGTTITLGAS